MKIKKLLFPLAAVLFGAFIFVYGRYDDSPGAQLIGLVLFVIGIIGVIKSRKKISQD